MCENALNQARETAVWDKFVCSIERHYNSSVLVEDEGNDIFVKPQGFSCLMPKRVGREALLKEWNNRGFL